MPQPEAVSPVDPDRSSNNDDEALESVRTILLAQEQNRLQSLEEEAEQLRREAARENRNLQQKIDNLQVRINELRAEAEDHRRQGDILQQELDGLRAQVDRESQALIPRLTGRLGGMVSDAIANSRDKMAEAMGPIMGDAIRVQIREARQDMIDALYPVIFETVQRAIAQFARDMQRNIDARLQSTFGARGILRGAWARLRGVSPSELTLRDALPFQLEELFLIQHQTGFLLTHYSTTGQESVDSDLISGMLTAIRDFTQDSFGDVDQSEDLDEIQYGDKSIIIESGPEIYIAAVIDGIEPSGFRARLKELVADLHVKYRPQLRDYQGDPATLSDFVPDLEGFSASLSEPRREVRPVTRQQKMVLATGGIAALLLLACACFYLQFTVALWPLAFGETATPSPTLTPTATPSPTVTSTATPTAVPPTSTSTPTPTSTSTPSPTSTSTSTPTSTATPSPTVETISPRTLAPVWVRNEPFLESPTILALEAGTELSILSRSGPWILVEWETEEGPAQGWVPLDWVDTQGQVPGG